MAIATQVFILFIVVLVGAICRRLGYLTDETIRGMTQLLVNVTLPCTTLVNMQRPFSREVLFGFLLTLGIAIALMVFSFWLGAWLFRRRPRAKRAVLAGMLAFSNCGFMGYPVILAANPDWMIYAVAYNVAYVLVSWTLGVSLYEGHGGISLRRIVLNPNLIAAALGFALFCLNISIPGVPLQALSLIGGLTTPVSMLIVGTRVYGVRLSDFKDMDYHTYAALRLLALPIALWALLRTFGAPYAVLGTAFLLTAMPAGTLTGMQAELYGGDKVFAARAAAYTTLLSLASVPLMCMLM